MKCAFAGLTDPGLVRPYNQDNHYIDPEGRFFILADGMGGHAGGEEASRIATQVIKDYLADNWEAPIESYDLLEKAIYQANEGILEDQAVNPQRADMGTTLVMIIFRNGETWRAHVGDSRLYRLRGETLEQVTLDHTWISQAIRAGEITPDDAKHHPWRHVLSQCLGRRDLYEGIDIQQIEETLSGDRFLLCSDGLTEEVSDELISKSLGTPEDLQEAASLLVQNAKDGGGSDNITVVLVAVE
ncbi:PP2C family protein-serine/threonine phosphatase [Geminocystis sp. CENA526]|uniref:PP2C family protein-serine/threonine phosphatase n=1 Tax=Geminocystis sp. CENA526 TaxID=1355871 RepID=UPI003D6E8FB0